MICPSLPRRAMLAPLCTLLVVSGWGCSESSSTPLADANTDSDVKVTPHDVADAQGIVSDVADSGENHNADGEKFNDSSDVDAGETTTPRGFGLDFDKDGVEDPADNCVFEPNPEQVDTDEDGEGDLCDADLDGDSVPNTADNWPEDDSLPGVTTPSLVYAHSAQTLFTLQPASATISLVGDFQWPSGLSDTNPSMADIAIDEFGVMYGVSFDDVFICHPTTVVCHRIGAAPKRFNGLTFVPKGIMNTDDDALIATTPDGGWHQVVLADDPISSNTLGNFGDLYASNGDAFSVQGMGTYVTAREQGAENDVLGKANPLTGEILDVVCDLIGYESVNGLAGWTNQIFVFDGSGDVLRVALNTGLVEIAVETETPWLGAAVRSKP